MLLGLAPCAGLTLYLFYVLARPIERALHRATAVDLAREHTWRQYAVAALAFSGLTQLITYALLRAQAALPHEANGSLLVQGGRVRGSSLLGQTLADPSAHPEYLWGRPSGASVDSATGVTYSSGSNYGPLNPAAVAIQVPRVARARAMSEGALRALVAAHTEGPTLGLLGEAQVNVLELNLALDAQAR